MNYLALSLSLTLTVLSSGAPALAQRYSQDDTFNAMPAMHPDFLRKLDDQDVDDDSADSVVAPSHGAYGGELFQPSDFVDTKFTKETFRDILETARSAVDRGVAPQGSDKRDLAKEDLSLVDFTRRPLLDDSEETWAELTAPMPNLLTDWVPSPVDPLDNGGFSIADDNGSPVPYHLNGHVPF